MALFTGEAQSWRGQLSSSALEVARQWWTRHEHANQASDDEALASTQVAVGYDAHFYGLEVNWAAAPVDVNTDVRGVDFTVPVRWAELPDASVRRATVRLELVGRNVNFAEFVLADGDDLEVLWENYELTAADRP